MALINQLDNTANVVYNGATVASNTVQTLLLVAPTILKTVDKLIASIGDVLTYTLTITNIGLTTITNLPFSDMIPEGSTYVAGSFKVNGATVTPTLTGNELSYTIPSIAALGIVTIVFQADVVGGEI